MITLISGRPGHGKTLFTLRETHKHFVEELGREVYYHGIKDLTLPGWHQLSEPEAWTSAPAGAVIVIDEASSAFHTLASGAEVPHHQQALATHRHSGYDIILICQHPHQCSTFVRKLVEKHIDYNRVGGGNKVIRREWPRIANPSNDKDRAESKATTVTLDPKFFEVYTSAEVHTVEPYKWGRLIVPGVIAICAAVALAVWGWSRVHYGLGGASAEVSASGAAGGTASDGRAAAGGVAGSAPLVADPSEFLKPRTLGEPWTAPAYDAVRQVVDYPRPQCLVWESGQQIGVCRCYSQQGTLMLVDQAVCHKVVRYGWWDPSVKQSPNGGAASRSEPPTDATPAREALPGGVASVGLVREAGAARSGERYVGRP